MNIKSKSTPPIGVGACNTYAIYGSRQSRVWRCCQRGLAKVHCSEELSKLVLHLVRRGVPLVKEV